VIGDVWPDDRHVLIIRAIHVRYHLRAPADKRETAERVHKMHADFCPVHESLKGSIPIDTSLDFVD